MDVLINNAGIFNVKPFDQYCVEDIDALVNTNLKGFVFPAQEAARHMAANKRGHIINITASIALQPNARVTATVPILIKGGINSVAQRQSPQALGEALRAKPLAVDVQGAVAAVRMHSPMLGFNYIDFLNLVKRDGRWQIVNKTFTHVE